MHYKSCSALLGFLKTEQYSLETKTMLHDESLLKYFQITLMIRFTSYQVKNLTQDILNHGGRFLL